MTTRVGCRRYLVLSGRAKSDGTAAGFWKISFYKGTTFPRTIEARVANMERGLFHGNQHVLQWNTFQLLALMLQNHRFRAKVAEWSVLPLVRPARKITDVSVSSSKGVRS